MNNLTGPESGFNNGPEDFSRQGTFGQKDSQFDPNNQDLSG